MELPVARPERKVTATGSCDSKDYRLADAREFLTEGAPRGSYWNVRQPLHAAIRDARTSGDAAKLFEAVGLACEVALSLARAHPSSMTEVEARLVLIELKAAASAARENRVTGPNVAATEEKLHLFGKKVGEDVDGRMAYAAYSERERVAEIGRMERRAEARDKRMKSMDDAYDAYRLGDFVTAAELATRIVQKADADGLERDLVAEAKRLLSYGSVAKALTMTHAEREAAREASRRRIETLLPIGQRTLAELTPGEKAMIPIPDAVLRDRALAALGRDELFMRGLGASESDLAAIRLRRLGPTGGN